MPARLALRAFPALLAGALALGPAVAADDARAAVAMPAPMAAHLLANMRDHLLALAEIQDALGDAQYDRAALIAEQRLGLSSLASHGAEHMAPRMPPAMREAGSAMHRAASRLATAIQDTGATGDLRPALAAMAAVVRQCAGCHAAFRLTTP